MMDWKTCFQGKKVLLAEDDEATCELMKDIFSVMQCELVIAKDGNEAIETFKNGNFDIVLMDVRMPNKDGMQATREIRALEKGGSKIPIFALTASVTEEAKKSCIDAGMTDFILKPIDIQNLREKMAKALFGR